MIQEQDRILFEGARDDWERQGLKMRRALLRSLDQEEHFAECDFVKLPAHVRFALILDWETEWRR